MILVKLKEKKRRILDLFFPPCPEEPKRSFLQLKQEIEKRNPREDIFFDPDFIEVSSIGFSAGAGSTVKVSSKCEVSWTCEYCKCVNPLKEIHCAHCGAPRRKITEG